MVQGIDNIGICATDLERSVRFYRRLGFAEAYRNERGVMMAAGRVQLFLFQTRRSNPTPVSRELGLFGNPPGIDHISFSVADVDGLYGNLMQAGVRPSGWSSSIASTRSISSGLAWSARWMRTT